MRSQGKDMVFLIYLFHGSSAHPPHSKCLISFMGGLHAGTDDQVTEKVALETNSDRKGESSQR